MFKTTFSVLFLLISYFSYSQACCHINFKYSGKVNSDKFKVDKIHLPSTAYFSGFSELIEERSFYVFNLESNSFSKQFISNRSGKFCMEPKLIIDEYFKQIKSYPIKITEKMKDHAGKFKTYTFAIPVEQIIFKIDDINKIEIILPEINLE